MRSIVWGVILVAFGSLLLLDRMSGWHVHLGRLWPLFIFAIAASMFAQRRIGAGIFFTLLGTVYLVCTLGLFGITYHSFGPLLIVVTGIAILLGGFTRGRRIRNGEVPRG